MTRVPAEVAVPVKDYLKAKLAVLRPGVTSGIGVPSNWTPQSPTHVGVFDDSGPAQWPIVTSPQIRVTVWSSGRTTSRELAGLCLGLLLEGVPGLVVVKKPTSIIDARDPQNLGLMASFTVPTKARTKTV